MLTERDVPRFELDEQSFVRPDFVGRGLANVAPTALQILAPRADPLALPPLDEEVLPLALRTDITTVIVLVVDGLGHLQLQREVAAGNAPNVGELIGRAAAGNPSVAYSAITSVFPSTTVAALGSINSGVAPTEHGLLAYTLYLSEFDMVAEMIRWGPLNRRGTFSDPEFDCAPESFFWAETLYARLKAAGVERAFAVNPQHFSGTALTRMLHQQATYRGYIATSSIDPILSRVAAETREPTYIYAYWPTVDTVSHLVGPLTEEHSAEVASFDSLLGRLLQHLSGRGDVLLMLTADHGHVDTSPECELSLGQHPELLEMLRVLPAGERRAVYLHPRAGAADDVFDYARERLGEVASVLRRDDAVSLGLFGPGPLSGRAAARIGEVLLFPRDNLQFVTPVESVDGTPLRVPVFRGLHGGLTPEEALVPLLALRV